MLALVAPGQGAQTPGFLNPWLELPRAKDLLTWWSAVAGVDLLVVFVKLTIIYNIFFNLPLI